MRDLNPILPLRSSDPVSAADPVKLHLKYNYGQGHDREYGESIKVKQ
jgi:hypothetical protein